MPQPDSSRNQAQDIPWNGPDRPWPVDPAAPRGAGSRRAPRAPRPEEQPAKDGRTPDDKDGNEELEREQEAPSSRRATTDRQAALNRARRELESEDTGEWVATERFTLDDELEDTWPNVPARYLDD
jgi:hypothetical protein